MKGFSTLVALIGIGILATGACGDSSDDDSPNTPRGGSAGRGGTSAGTSGKGGRAGQGGSGGHAAVSAEGGAEPTPRGGSSGKAGGGGSSAGHGGSSAARGGSSAGHGGSSAGGISGQAGASGDAGTAGASGGTSCFVGTTADWGDITPSRTSDYRVYASLIESGAFPGIDALLEVILYLGDFGTFVLGTGDNANWSTCMQCVLVRVDGGSEPDRLFFADAGVLRIDSASSPLHGTLDASLTNAHFVEVTIDQDPPYESHAIEGGSCLERVTTSIDVEPNGQGGAGGRGGEGGYGGAFDAPDNCIEVSSGDWITDVHPTWSRYVSLISPNVGSSLEDAFILGFFSDAVGEFRIGHDVDSRFSTCERCFLANVSVEGSDGLWFYGVDGTLDVAEGSAPLSGNLEATMTNVTFKQVDPYTLETPVENGECLHLATGTISSP